MNSKHFKTLLCFCFGILLMFSSCKKSVKAQGSVVDCYTGAGVADVQVTVNETKKRLGEPDHKEWNSITDSNGEFNVNFVGHKTKRYTYYVSLPFSSSPDTTLFYERTFLPMLDNGYATHNIEWKGTNDLVLKVAPTARVIIITRNPFNKPIDVLNFSWLATDYEVGIVGNSGGVGTTTPVYMASNGQSILKIVFSSNGTTKTTLDTFATVPFQITRHEITL